MSVTNDDVQSARGGSDAGSDAGSASAERDVVLGARASARR